VALTQPAAAVERKSWMLVTTTLEHTVRENKYENKDNKEDDEGDNDQTLPPTPTEPKL
jgi:hypothetical protein